MVWTSSSDDEDDDVPTTASTAPRHPAHRSVRSVRHLSEKADIDDRSSSGSGSGSSSTRSCDTQIYSPAPTQPHTVAGRAAQRQSSGSERMADTSQSNRHRRKSNNKSISKTISKQPPNYNKGDVDLLDSSSDLSLERALKKLDIGGASTKQNQDEDAPRKDGKQKATPTSARTPVMAMAPPDWLSSRNTKTNTTTDYSQDNGDEDSNSSVEFAPRQQKQKPQQPARRLRKVALEICDSLDAGSSSSDDSFLESRSSSRKHKQNQRLVSNKNSKNFRNKENQQNNSRKPPPPSRHCRNKKTTDDDDDEPDEGNWGARKPAAATTSHKQQSQSERRQCLHDSDEDDTLDDRNCDPSWKGRGRFVELTVPNGQDPDLFGYPALQINKKLFQKLYPHQKTGLQWLAADFHARPGKVLGDDMGMGKTLMTLAFLGGLMKTRTIRNALVVAPVSVVTSWEREAYNVCGSDVRIVVCKSSDSTTLCQRTLRGALRCSNHGPIIIITTYGMVRSRTSDFRDGTTGGAFDFVVLDEGHTIKNGQSGISRACSALCRPGHTHRLLLTGTPIMNRLNELWAVFDWATAGQVLGDETTFKRRFGKPIENARDMKATSNQIRLGQQASQELRQLLVPRHFLQRTKAEYLANQLPSKTEIIVWTHLSPLQRDMYSKYLQEESVQDMVRGRVKKSPLEAITELKKLCGHPRLCMSESAEELADFLSCDDASIVPQLVDESDKLRLLRDLVETLALEHHKTLIFSQSTRTLDIIAKVLGSSTSTGGASLTLGRIDGQTTGSLRQGLVDEFNSPNSNLQVLLLSTKAAGVGLTLTGADRAIIYDPSWTPAEDSQAVDRCYRIGQTKPVVVYRMIAAGAVEEKMYEKQVFKDGIRRSVLDEGGSVSTQRYFEANELKKMFTLGRRGTCGVMDKIAKYRITFDPRPHNYILRHECTVGLSRHDVFYKLDKNSKAPPAVELPSKPTILGRSQRVLQKRSNASNTAPDPKSRGVPLAVKGGQTQKQTLVRDYFHADNGKKTKRGNHAVVDAGAGQEVIDLLISSSDEEVGDTRRAWGKENSQHVGHPTVLSEEDLSEALALAPAHQASCTSTSSALSRFYVSQNDESDRDSFGAPEDLQAKTRHNGSLDNAPDVMPNDNVYAENSDIDMYLARLMERADQELALAKPRQSLDILLNMLEEYGKDMKSQALNELHDKIGAQAYRLQLLPRNSNT